MSDLAIIAIIAAIAPTLVAGAAWYTAHANKKAAQEARAAAMLAAEKAEKAEVLAAEARGAIVRTEDGIHELGKRVDGRLEELLRLTEKEAEARGMAAGIASERADPQSPREEERRLDSGPIEVVGVADSAAEPIRTISVEKP